MKISGFNYALTSCAAAAMLAGCGGSPPPIAMQQTSAIAPRSERTRARPAYDVVYSFKAAEDGNYPYATLINFNPRRAVESVPGMGS